MVLDFKLEDGAEPSQCVLHLANKGSAHVAFKVKTTKPKRYLVRPNQGVVAPSGNLAVSILLLAEDKTKLLQELRQNGECNESNKFMVQSLTLDNADNHNTAVAVPNELWEAEKARVQRKKLIVCFSFPRGLPSPGAGGALKQNRGGMEGIDGGTEKGRAGGRAEGREEGMEGGRGGGGEGGREEKSQDQMWAQAKALRGKYDDLVSFTINLTAEKDLIQRSLMATKEDLQKEQQVRKQLETQMMEPGARRAGGAAGKLAPAERRTGFSLFFVLLMAMVALFAGQWTAANGYALIPSS
eukprot:jgi/Undpi1/5701/HiC_scaffold_2.g00975.m1